MRYQPGGVWHLEEKGFTDVIFASLLYFDLVIMVVHSEKVGQV